MEQRERVAARTQALRLLKTKLHQSGRAHRRIAAETTSSSSSEICHDGNPATTLSIHQPNEIQETPPLAADTTAREERPPAPVSTRLHDHGSQRTLLKKLVVQWSCTRCQRECIPIREESRCLCGHRYKEHPSSNDGARVAANNKTSAAVAAGTAFRPFACTATKCACRAFFYVVAEGAWILRCRCKHKHTDHDASSRPFPCRKPTCACDGFGSPWVCNCNHPWSDHVQETVEKEFRPLDLGVFDEPLGLDDLSNVQRTDLVHEPLRLHQAR